MDRKQGFPYAEIEFTKNGEIFDQVQLQSIIDAVEAEAITDLVLLSHGWKNGIEDARDLYNELIGNIRMAVDRRDVSESSNTAFVGVLWPAKKYTEIELQAGGGASMDGVISNEHIKSDLASLVSFSDRADAADLVAEATRLVDDLEDKKSAQNRFVDLVYTILEGDDEGVDAEIDSEMPPGLGDLSGTEIFDKLSRPGLGEFGGGGGGEAGLNDIFGGIKGGVMNFLNITTYWKMKKRAGKVGARGFHDVLITLSDRFSSLRLHLVGHSFGGRVVTAAVQGPSGESKLTVNSLILLQAAFSHNAFAENIDSGQDGFFRKVLTNNHISGPLIVTHTKNDRAVGLAYPLASRLSGDRSAGVGDATDPFGGLGRNGALGVDAIERSLLESLGAYNFHANRIYNLLADEHIADHGDVRNPSVANMVAQAIIV